MFWFYIVGDIEFFWLKCFCDCGCWSCIWGDVGFGCIGDGGLLFWGVGGCCGVIGICFFVVVFGGFGGWVCGCGDCVYYGCGYVDFCWLGDCC